MGDTSVDVQSYELHGIGIVEFPKTGYLLANDRHAIDIISEAAAHQPDIIVIPVERFADDFFRLKTRIAGEIFQKFVAYHKRVAILGDISAHLNESTALRDFVYECNNGRDIWFVTNLNELDRKIQTFDLRVDPDDKS